MPDREQRHIQRDMLHPVQEEHHAQEEQDVVIAGGHVFRAQIGECDQIYSRYFLDVALVAFGDRVSQRPVSCE